MVELPKTDAELQAYVDEQIQAKQTEWESKQNEMFAAQRKKHQAEIDKIKADAGKSAEQLADERIKEQNDQLNAELDDLRKFKKSTLLGQKLEKEGLPSYFKNDNRLLTAEDGDLDKVIKDVKKEYEATLPKGNTHSSVVQQGGATPVGGNKTDEQAANEAMAQFLEQAISR